MNLMTLVLIAAGAYVLANPDARRALLGHLVGDPGWMWPGQTPGWIFVQGRLGDDGTALAELAASLGVAMEPERRGGTFGYTTWSWRVPPGQEEAFIRLLRARPDVRLVTRHSPTQPA